jgi:ABC-type dipeptide/oligopeptide/nickel transport system ATPase component
MAQPILEVKDLQVHFPIRRGLLQRTVGHVKAVDGVSFDVANGQTMGIVGESGSGKSVTSLSIMQLIPNPPGKITGGEIIYHTKDNKNQFRHV